MSQVVRESMNRRIPNGAWCLFKLSPPGTRQGKVVLVQHREIFDADTGRKYTIKVYHSEKVKVRDGMWRHKRITLRPDTTASGYEPIEISPDVSGKLTVVEELVAVLT